MNDQHYIQAKRILWKFKEELGASLPNNLDISSEDFIHPYEHLRDPSFLIFDLETYELIDIRLYNKNIISLEFLTQKELKYLRAIQIDNSPLNKLPEWLTNLQFLSNVYIRNCELKEIPHSFWDNQSLYAVDFSGNHLSDLPHAIHLHPKLISIKLNNNNFTHIPDLIYKLSKLDHLEMNNNSIQNILDKIMNLQSIECIKLKNNNIRKITNNIGKIDTLIRLYLESNKITNLPISIGNLKKLEHLDLSSNNIKSLPDSIGLLSKLEILWLDNNGISQLPHSFQNLTSLHQLNLEHNPIEFFSFDIDACPNLINLDLSSTRFKDFLTLRVFPNLEKLYLEELKLNHIPQDLLQYLLNSESLACLSLSGNEFTTYPKDLVSILQKKIDFFYFQENPFSLEERFFLQELFVVEPSDSMYEKYRILSEREQQDFYREMNLILMQFLELDKNFMPRLFQKLTGNKELTFLDFHHPDLLLHEEKIKQKCQIIKKTTSKSFVKYLDQRRKEFNIWKIEERDQIDCNFRL